MTTAFQPITVASDSDYSTEGRVEFGVTEGDVAGQVYIETNQRTYFTPAKVKEVFPALKAAFDRAAADSMFQRVTVNVSVAATDAEIVSAVRSKLVPVA